MNRALPVPSLLPYTPRPLEVVRWALHEGMADALQQKVSTLREPGRLSDELSPILDRARASLQDRGIGRVLMDPEAWRELTSDLSPSQRRAFHRQLLEHLCWLAGRDVNPPPSASQVPAPAQAAPLALPVQHPVLTRWLSERGLKDLYSLPMQALEKWDPQVSAHAVLRRGVGHQLGALLVNRHRDAFLEQVQHSALRLLEEEDRDLQGGFADEPLRLASFAAGPAHPALTGLFQQLRERREAIREEHRPCSEATFQALELKLTHEPLRLLVHHPRLRLLGVSEPIQVPLERKARRGQDLCPCSRWRYGEDEPCRHLLAAYEAGLRFLATPSPEVEALADHLSRPEWDHTLRRLRSVLVPLPVSKKVLDPEATALLLWSVEEHYDTVRLTPILKKPLRKGGHSKGAPVRLRDVASGTATWLQPVDRRAAAALHNSGGQSGVELALSLLAGTGRVYFEGDLDRPATVVEGDLSLEIRSAPDGSLRIVPAVEGWELPEDAFEDLAYERERTTLVRADPEAGKVAVIHLRGDALAGLEILQREGSVFPKEAGPALLEAFSATPFEGNLPPELLGEEVPSQPRPALFVTPQGELAFLLEARVRCLDQPLPLPVAQGPRKVRGTREGRPVFAQRDFEAEQALADGLWSRLGLTEGGGDSRRVEGEAALTALQALEALEQEGLEVGWPAARPRFKRAVAAGDLRLSVSAGRDWFGLSGQAEVDGERLELAALLQAARTRQRYVRLERGGWTQLSEQLLAQLAPVAEASEDGAEGPRLSRIAGVLLQPLEAQVAELRACEDFKSLSTRLREAGEFQPRLPEGLQATLRPYQQEGYEWLARLARWSPGAVLADDMGLGKTLQALALLLARKELGPALVVAPTSLGFNWEQEAARFTPGLRVVSYRHGGREEVFANLGPGDLLVVSYGLLTQAAERFAQQRFATLVIDEAHAVKNGATLRSRVVRDLQADFRLALTGTPLENHLGELWSLFRTVVPGLLGSEDQFRQRFWLPVEKHKDPQRRRSLSRLIGPFLLRRKKAQVALDLPDRTEILRPVALSAPERRLYEEARLAAVAELAGLDSGPPEQRRFKVLSAITRLRLLACHPALHDPQWTGPASKLEALLELVDELRSEGHRILVFSQFTQHLEKVRAALQERGVSFQYLDGSTPEQERRRRVEAFQAGEGELFLISLKAGGMGLNLTAANYVIHLDPWWNPAVEDQATDRAHRIGQTRAVTVYRLVAQGTIEESILALHGEKRELITGVLEGTGVAARLGTEELTALLEGAARGEVDADVEAAPQRGRKRKRA